MSRQNQSLNRKSQWLRLSAANFFSRQSLRRIDAQRVAAASVLQLLLLRHDCIFYFRLLQLLVVVVWRMSSSIVYHHRYVAQLLVRVRQRRRRRRRDVFQCRVAFFAAESVTNAAHSADTTVSLRLFSQFACEWKQRRISGAFIRR